MALTTTTAQPEVRALRGIALGGLLAESVSTFGPGVIELNVRRVSTDMEIVDEIDSVKRFSFTLFAQPWPRAGDRVWFVDGPTRFRGFVTRTSLRAENGCHREWTMSVEGYVEEFEGKALLD